MSMPPLSDAPVGRPWPEMPLLPTSWGDVFDRFTILRLKQACMVDPVRLANVARELDVVIATIGDTARFPPALRACLDKLHAVNEAIWKIEESKRDCERKQQFDDGFIALARAVYLQNDLRARIKKEINLLLGSALIEEKSH